MGMRSCRPCAMSLEKFRCSACGQVFTASAPAEAGAEKYSARARAVLVLGRYYLGVPLYRLEGYQAMVGVPVADATQWDQIERVADCAYPVFEQLKDPGGARRGDLPGRYARADFIADSGKSSHTG